MVSVCDRCRKELDSKYLSSLNGEEFELCIKCSEHIANHIRKFKPSSLMGGLFKK